MKKALLIIFIGLCSSFFLKLLSQSPLSGYIISQQNILCDSSNLGNVAVSGFGGIAPYRFELDGSGIFLPGDVDYNGDLILDKAFANLTFGLHNIVVKDTAEATFTIPVDIAIDEFIIGIINVTDIDCAGSDDGQITAGVVTGGTIPIEWSIDGGSNWQGTELFAGLAGGPYIITARDDLGCVATYDTLVAIGDESYIEVLANNDVKCFGDADGSVVINTINGTAPFSYSLDAVNWQVSGTFSGLNAGLYTFYSMGSSDCITDTTFEVGQPDDLLIENFIVINNACYGDNQGAVSFNVTGGVPGYSYQLNSNPVVLPIGGLVDGFYTLIVTDTNACTVFEEFSLTDPEELIISIDNSTNVTCFGGNDGSITVSAIGGTGAIQYSINGGALQGVGLFINLNAGNHSVLVEDANGCQTTQNVQLLQPSQITATPVVDHPDCLNAANGSIDFLNPAGGLGPPYSYTYSDDGGAVFQPFALPLNNLIPGNYIIRIYDMDGICYNEYSFNLIADSDLNIDSFDVIAAVCGITGGEVTINVSGGQAPYTYNLSGNVQVGNPVFLNIPAGNYPVIITDALGCSVSSTVDVGEGTDIVITHAGGNNEYCGNIDGEIEITVSGGTTDYLFNITGDAITYGPDPTGWTFVGLTAGIYTITVTDDQGCTQTIDINLTNEEPPDLDIIFGIPVDDFCENGVGEITATGVGGNPDYLFELIPPGGAVIGPTPFTTFSNLTSGDYDVIMTDFDGCSIILPFEIVNDSVDPSLHFVFIDTTSASCLESNDGEIIVDGIGGSGEFEFAINGNPNTPVTSGVFSNLLPGTYTITILDTTTTCTLDTSIVVDYLSTLALNLIEKDSVCVAGDTDGFITVQGSGGSAPYNYSIVPAVGLEINGAFTGIPAGTYEIKVTDGSGCTQMIDVVMEIRPPFPFSFDADSVSCNGYDDGQITVWASTGPIDPPSATAPYTFEISSNPGVPEGPWDLFTFDPLSPILYSILLTDSKGCEQTIPDIEIEEPDPIGFLAFPDDTIQLRCFGDVTMDSTLFSYNYLFVSGSGGVPGYEYSVNGGFFVPGNTGSDWHQLIGFPAGTIDIDIKDASACIYSTELVVEEPSAPLEATFNITDNSCIGDSLGVIEVNATGGWGVYYYQIDGMTGWQVSNTFSGLPPGSYTVNIIDNLNNDALNEQDCQVSYLVDIDLTDPLAATLSILNHPGCDLASNGSVQIDISQGYGASPIQLFIDGFPAADVPINSNPYIVNDLAEGMHNFVLNNGACTVTMIDSLTNIDDLQLTFISETPIECPLDSNGIIEFSADGGVSPLYYEIDGLPFAGPPAATDLSLGPHTIVVTDSIGCMQSMNVAVSTLSTLEGFASTVDALCDDGISTGSVIIFATQGPSPFLFWEESEPDSIFTGTQHEFLDLLVGDYNFWVRDANGCEIILPVSINELSGVEFDLDIIQNPVCHGDTNAIVSINASGTPPFEYSLNDTTYIPFPTGSVVTSILLPAGNQTIWVEAQNGCKTQDSILIVEPDTLLASVDYQVPVHCFGDSTAVIEINPSGGISGYQFSLNESGFGPDSVFANLIAGFYLYAVADSNGCVLSDSMNINQPELIDIGTLTVSGTDCFGDTDSTGSIVVEGNGGSPPYSYSLDGGPSSLSGLFENLVAGDHLVLISDKFDCSFDTLVHVLAPDSLFLGSVNTTDILCFGDSTGSVEAIATGGTPGYVYQMPLIDTNLTGLFTSLPIGEYIIVAIDTNGCEFQDTVVLIEPPELLLSVSDIQNLNCFNDSSGQVQFNAEGGVTPYLFGQNLDDLDTAGLIGGLSADTSWFYTVDANLCIDSILVDITEPDSLWLTFDIIQPIDCYDSASGEFEINGIGGTTDYLYSINSSAFGPDSVISNASAGNYIVNILDRNLCEFTDTLILDQPDQITFNAIVTSVDCYNNQSGSIEIIATGGTPEYLYSLDSLSWYTVSVFAGFATGNQSIYIIDNNNCVVDSVVFISQPDSISTAYSELSLVTCAGYSNAEVQFEVSGGTPPYIGVFESDTLIITDSVLVLDNLAKGNYQISIYDGNDCENINLFSLNEPDTIAATIEPVELLCFGDKNGVGTVSASGGTGSFAYKWNNITADETPTSQENLAADISYIAKVFEISDSTCLVTAEVIPTQPPQIKFVLTPLSSSCDIDDRDVLIEINSGGVEPFLYLTGTITDTSEAVSDPYFSDLTDELTSFFVIDSTGCVEENIITPFNPNIPKALFVVDNNSLSFLDPLLNLTDQSGNHVTVTWDFGDGIVLSGGIYETFDEPFTWGPVVSPTHEYQMPGDYEIEIVVSSAFGCLDSSSREIYIQSEDLIYIPNAFTPGGDGDNDIFNVKGSGLQSEGFSMQVYERRGRLVYQTFDINMGWDGQDLKGSDAPPAMYIYVIRVFSGDRLIEKGGSVLLIR